MAWENHAEIEDAHKLNGIKISQAIYQQISKNNPNSWIKFEAKSGDNLDLELGLPKLDSLLEFRPTIELISPSNKSTELSSINVLNPKVFYEPFTQTNSWVLWKNTIPLSESGTYYLVSSDPKNEFGKLWIAIGREESFGASDLLNLPISINDVKAFHAPNNQKSGSSKILIISFLICLSLVLIIFRKKIVRIFYKQVK